MTSASKWQINSKCDLTVNKKVGVRGANNLEHLDRKFTETRPFSSSLLHTCSRRLHGVHGAHWDRCALIFKIPRHFIENKRSQPVLYIPHYNNVAAPVWIMKKTKKVGEIHNFQRFFRVIEGYGLGFVKKWRKMVRFGRIGQIIKGKWRLLVCLAEEEGKLVFRSRINQMMKENGFS